MATTSRQDKPLASGGAIKGASANVAAIPDDGVSPIAATGKNLPTLPSQVTAEWLSTVLPHKVASVEMTDQQLAATTSKLFATLTWADPAAAAADGMPTRVCIKGGFNPAIIAAMPPGIMQSIYSSEALWFKHIAPKLKAPVEVPKCWWSDGEVDDANAICIFDDLNAKGCTFPDGIEDRSVEWMKEALQQLASVHATTWGADEKKLGWLPTNPPYFPTMLGLISLWEAQILGPDRPPLPDAFKDQARVSAAIQKHWRARDAATECVIHGDPHVGNTYMLPDGRPRFLDWQLTHRGSALSDVAYCLGSALSIADRRAHEEELIGWYCDCLAATGAPALDKAHAFAQYKRGLIMGWGWLLTPTGFQPKERIFAIVARFRAALEDHKVLELIEAIKE